MVFLDVEGRAQACPAQPASVLQVAPSLQRFERLKQKIFETKCVSNVDTRVLIQELTRET